MKEIRQSFVDAKKMIDDFAAVETNIEKIKKAGELMADCVRNNHKIISCGNGGSMSDAMHFAEELTGLFRDLRPAVPAISISDPSHITCAANDFGFEHIFLDSLRGSGSREIFCLPSVQAATRQML